MPLLDDVKRSYQRGWVADRRAAFFADKACLRCGAATDLQLHHRDRADKVSHKIWSWTPARLAAELAKCDVVCGDCHRRIHAEERRAEAIARRPHGTCHRYELGCKCQACRRAKSLSSRVYRLRRRLAMTATIESWLGVVQTGDDQHEQETELVTLVGLKAEPGATIETTDGRRITLLEPAEVAEAVSPARQAA